MIKKGITAIIISILCSTSSITAQQMLSLEQCRQLAIENNKALKIATEQEKIAYYNKKEALSKFFPQVQFIGGYMHNQKNLHLIPSSAIPSSIPLPIPIGEISSIPIPDIIRSGINNLGEVGIKDIWSGGFNLTQPIVMSGKSIAYNDARSYAQQLAEPMNETQKTEAIVEVDNAYWQVRSLANKKT